MGKTKKQKERKSRSQSDQNTKNQKTKIWDERNKNYVYTSKNQVDWSFHFRSTEYENRNHVADYST